LEDKNLVIALSTQVATHVSNNYLAKRIVKKDVNSVHSGALTVTNMGKSELGATLPGKRVIRTKLLPRVVADTRCEIKT
jgi:hypothetical protein